MTTILIAILLGSLLYPGAAGADGEQLPISPRLRYVIERQDTVTTGDLHSKSLTGATAVTALVSLDPDEAGGLRDWARENEADLTILSDSTAVIRLPAKLIIELSSLPAIRYLSYPSKLKPTLDVSLAETGADDVHLPAPSSSLTRAYTGKGVIIGVVDTGIDWRHDDFVTAAGTSRFLYIWDQTDSRGPAPGGTFTTGTEYDRETINRALEGENIVFEKDTDGHGTHVSGIAASGGRAAGGVTGLAPEADLILVKTDFGIDDVMSGVSYIVGKANEHGRPCVINLSLGTHDGPHDGTATFCQHIDDVSGKGIIVVASAGNEGDELFHLGYSVSETSRATPFTFSYSVTHGYVDIWYDPPAEIDFRVQALDLLGNELADTGWVVPGDTVSKKIPMGLFSSGTMQLNATETENPLNGARHVVFDAAKGTLSSINESALQFTLHARGSGDFDAWIESGHFDSSDDGAEYSGNGLKSVGLPATAAQAIAVANYVSKNSWSDLDGTTRTHWELANEISNTSSRGPSRREDLTGPKPEIAAPGTFIASALSENYGATRSRTTPDGVHVLLTGTSMSAPHVSGTVALMLEAKSDLSPAEAEQYLTGQARQDSFVGETVPNNTWGYGKLDTLAVMETMDEDLQPPPVTPTGTIILSAEPQSLSADGQSEAVITSDLVLNTNGNSVSDGELFDVLITTGPGSISPVSGGSFAAQIEVASASGRISFILKAASSPGSTVISAASRSGDAGGEITVELYGIPEINIQGNGRSIASGDTSPEDADSTDFGEVIVGEPSGLFSYTVLNSGNGDLLLTGSPAVTVSGQNYSEFDIATEPAQTVAPTNSTSFQVRFTPTGAGTRQATLALANNDGDENPYSFTVQGSGLAEPEAAVAATPLSGIAPLKVSFNGTGSDEDGYLITYEWDFDGNGTYDWESTESGITDFTFTAAGEYTARFRVTDNDGLTASESLIIEVVPNQIPMASITVSPIGGTAPLQVTLTGSGSDSDGGISVFEWDFEGDGVYDRSEQQSVNLTYTYRTPGIYQPTLRVTDNGGSTGTAETTVTVEYPDQYPDITILSQPDPPRGPLPLTVSFSVQTDEFDTGINRFEWDFDGDKTFDTVSATTDPVSTTYGSVGTYQVRLTATGDDGTTTVDDIEVTVLENESVQSPEIVLADDSFSGELPLTVTISATVSDTDGSVAEVRWDFDGDGVYEKYYTADGITNGTVSASTEYHNPGLFPIRVTVIDNDGLTATASAEATVWSPASLTVWMLYPVDDRAVSGSAVTLAALTSSLDQTQTVTFEYRAAAGPWLPLGAAEETTRYTATWDTSLVDEGTYEIRAAAVDSGSVTRVSEPVEITIDHTTPDSSESLDVSGHLIRRELMDPDNAGKLILSDGSEVRIPAGLLIEESVIIVSVQESDLPRQIPSIETENILPAGLYREFELESGQTDFSRSITLTFPYSDSDNDGLVDDTDIAETSLLVYWYDETGNTPRWKKEPFTMVFPNENYVEARVTHFSIFSTGTPGPEPAPPAGTDSSSGGGGGCFIATAAFGGPGADDVTAFRGLRDRYLQPFPVGRLAMNTYYQLSPPLAALIGGSEEARLITRSMLKMLLCSILRYLPLPTHPSAR